MNYYPDRDGRIAELDDESTTTSELLQRTCPTRTWSRRSTTSTSATSPRSPARPGATDRSALAIAGDDADAKAIVRALLDEIGYDTLDLGPLAEGWRIQRDTAAYGTPYAADPTNWAAGPGQATADTLAEAAARAQRYRDM